MTETTDPSPARSPGADSSPSPASPASASPGCGGSDESDAPRPAHVGRRRLPRQASPHKYGMTTIEQRAEARRHLRRRRRRHAARARRHPGARARHRPALEGVGRRRRRGRARRSQGDKPVVASNQELEFEKVAAARPDLITAVEYDLKQPDYKKLSDLAPTVPPPKGFAPYTVPWDTMAVQVGASLGRKADAERLVKAHEGRDRQGGEGEPEVREQQGRPDRSRRRRRRLHLRRERRPHALPRRPRLHHAGRDREAVQRPVLRPDQRRAARPARPRRRAHPRRRRASRRSSSSPRRGATRTSRPCASSGLVTIDDPDLAIAMSYSSVAARRPTSCARSSRACVKPSREPARDRARADLRGAGAGAPAERQRRRPADPGRPRVGARVAARTAPTTRSSSTTCGSRGRSSG